MSCISINSIIDTHCHLNFKQFAVDRDAVIERAKMAGIEGMIVVGTDKGANFEAVELSKKYDCLWATIGFHPIHANQIYEAKLTIQEVVESLEILARGEKVVGIGEIGLDYSRENFDKGLQRELFKAMSNLAKRFNMPVIIHCRDATGDMFELLKEEDVTGVWHCFSGNVDEAREAIKMGFLLGFNGLATYNEHYAEVLKAIPLENIVLETDCPYLSPQEKRGQRNEPAFLSFIVAHIAEIKDETEKNIRRITFENSMKMFNL